MDARGARRKVLPLIAPRWLVMISMGATVIDHPNECARGPPPGHFGEQISNCGSSPRAITHSAPENNAGPVVASTSPAEIPNSRAHPRTQEPWHDPHYSYRHAMQG